MVAVVPAARPRGMAAGGQILRVSGIAMAVADGGLAGQVRAVAAGAGEGPRCGLRLVSLRPGTGHGTI